MNTSLCYKSQQIHPGKYFCDLAYHLVHQAGSRRVTSSILQYNQAAFISETMISEELSIFGQFGKLLIYAFISATF